MNSTPRSATTLQDYGKFFSVAGSLDISFGSLFLKAPFCPKKGVFKGQKQPVFRSFCNYIKGLLRSDPQRQTQRQSIYVICLKYVNKSPAPPLPPLLVQRQENVPHVGIEVPECQRPPVFPYLKLTRLNLGYLLNWNVVLMKDGIKRMVNNLKQQSAVRACFCADPVFLLQDQNKTNKKNLCVLRALAVQKIVLGFTGN